MGRLLKRKRLMRWALLLGASLISLSIVGAVLMAITERFIHKQDKSMLVYDFHALRRQVLLPNQAFDSGTAHFTINEYGLRGASPAMPKPEGVVRIFGMGGSSAFDHLLSEGQSWPERLGSLLSESGVAAVESFNAGIPGYCSRETLALYKDKIRYLAPDVVVFYLGWNDVKYMDAFKDGVDVDAFFYVTDFSDHNKLFKAPRPLRNWYAMKMMYLQWREDAGDHVIEQRRSKKRDKRREPKMNYPGPPPSASELRPHGRERPAWHSSRRTSRHSCRPFEATAHCRSWLLKTPWQWPRRRRAAARCRFLKR